MDILQEKVCKFALRIVKLSEYLNNEKKEFVLSRKILDSAHKCRLAHRRRKTGRERT